MGRHWGEHRAPSAPWPREALATWIGASFGRSTSRPVKDGPWLPASFEANPLRNATDRFRLHVWEALGSGGMLIQRHAKAAGEGTGQGPDTLWFD